MMTEKTIGLSNMKEKPTDIEQISKTIKQIYSIKDDIKRLVKTVSMNRLDLSKQQVIRDIQRDADKQKLISEVPRLERTVEALVESELEAQAVRVRGGRGIF